MACGQKQRGAIFIGIGFILACAGIGYYVNVGEQADEIVSDLSYDFIAANEDDGKFEVTFTYTEYDELNEDSIFQSWYIWYDDGGVSDDEECQRIFNQIETFTYDSRKADPYPEFDDDDFTDDLSVDCTDSAYTTRDGNKRRFASFRNWSGEVNDEIKVGGSDTKIWGQNPQEIDNALGNLGDAAGSAVLAFVLWVLAGVFSCIACCCFGGCCGKDASVAQGGAPDDDILPITK